ncbi:phosphonate C-P lyase system protein PhnH [Bradyrhizobium altum]|uniref:phosphonate C-P lyase system protein PhnH n=1 Tax=Bradyrhizobium altum TaxID=1571202 RepID=UPI001E4723F3|nr:phosphonate C-P lyase system protein PhnH [Bradyrhizobium altum]
MSDIHSGFRDPVLDSQDAFRTVLSCNAYPGRTFTLSRSVDGPSPFCIATAALCLTLLDFETLVWLEDEVRTDKIVDWLTFHCGSPLTKDHREAQFAIVANAQSIPSLLEFRTGEIESPELSSTLIVQVPSLVDGPVTRWSGPGIRDSICPRIGGLSAQLWLDREMTRELYPRGLDVFFTSGSSIVGLPRTTNVEF